MLFHEAIKLVTDGKYKKLSYEHWDFIVKENSFGSFLYDDDGDEFEVSNIEWFLSDKWEVKEEALPEGVVRGEDGKLYKKEIYERWIILVWNGRDFYTYSYANEKEFLDSYIRKVHYLDVVNEEHVVKELLIPYKG